MPKGSFPTWVFPFSLSTQFTSQKTTWHYFFFIASPFTPTSTLPAHSLSVCSVCALCSPPLWVEPLHLCPMWQHPLIFFFHFSCSSHSLLPYQDDLLRIKTKSHKSFIFRGFLFLLQDSVLTFLWLALKNHAQHIDWAPVTVFFQFLEQTMLPFTSGSLLILFLLPRVLFFSPFSGQILSHVLYPGFWKIEKLIFHFIDFEKHVQQGFHRDKNVEWISRKRKKKIIGDNKQN